MNINTGSPIITFDGIPSDVEVWFEHDDMVIAETRAISYKHSAAVVDKAKVTRWYTITLSINAIGEIVKQSAAIETATAPAWIP